MRTLNKKYRDNEDLKSFISSNDIINHKNILLQVFTAICDVAFIESLIKTIRTQIPHIKIVGSTTSGEILEDETFEGSTILSFSLFEETTIETYFTDTDKNSNKTAKRLISQFDDQKIPRVAISFADGLTVNGEEFINTFNDYDHNLIVAGGLAGDNANFINTIVFTQDKVSVNGAVIALLFSDVLTVHTKASFGWENIGKTMTITKSKQNIVYEIDNIKAVDIYAKYLGEDIAANLPKVGVEFPLIVKRGNLQIPRAIMAKGTDGSLTFAGNLNVGDKITFGYGNIESILDYTNRVSSKCDTVNCESIFVYSCMARKSLMKNSVSMELVPLSNITNVSGFFTYGEFFSDCKTLKHELLNQTMTILSLSESIKPADENESTHSRLSVPIEDERENALTLKALSHLISQTSLELEETNKLLEQKVIKEVQKNRAKDQYIMEQSRLAQMGEMLSMIAHQWRQPLAAISSTSTSISIKAELGRLNKANTIELAEKISHYSQHLSTTIDDFRDFFKPNKVKKDTNYTEIIQGVLSIVEVSIINKNITLVTHLNCDTIFNTYTNEIKQVVLNLIKNAEDVLIEREVDDPTITIESSNGVLSVKDNGGGISIEIIENIFDPYFSTKLGKNGTGLGLYMSKTIVEEHCNGILGVRNNHEGTVFTIEL